MSLPIATLPVGAGALGIAPCPGLSAGLDADIATLRDWGAGVVVSLIEPDEYTALGVSDLPERLRAAGIAHHALPIPDFGLPDPDTLAAWTVLAAQLRHDLAQGGRALIHCRGGLGRSGTLAAHLLITGGMPPRAAIDTVRRLRPGAIETAGQERWLLETPEQDDRAD